MTRIKGRKFDAKGEEVQLIGFNAALHSYRLITRSGRVVETKHVKFLKRADQQLKIDSDDDIQFSPEEAQVEDLLVLIDPTLTADHREIEHD